MCQNNWYVETSHATKATIDPCQFCWPCKTTHPQTEPPKIDTQRNNFCTGQLEEGTDCLPVEKKGLVKRHDFCGYL